MPLVTRTVIVYIDDELVEVDIEVEEPLQGNICRVCEKVELPEDADIICPACWLSVEEVDLVTEKETEKEKDDNDDIEDDDMSYRSFKEMIRKRTQSDESSEGGDI
jgi:coenzyme F420-reducing hydrogenase beta subunit